jgi:HSP20 family molecular chaperone IbpA
MSEAIGTSPSAPEGNGTQQGKQYRPRAVSPSVDVFENGDEVLVIADVPGVSTASIDVRVENGTLTLEAKRVTENVGPALAREYVEVDFARTFRIPAGIDTANIKAEAKNGTVIVTLPKIAAVKARKIVVQST